MARDLHVDQGSSAVAEPGVEHGRDRSPIRGREADDELIAGLASYAGHRRSAAAAGGGRGHDPQEVELAAVADRRSIAEPATRRELGSLLGVALEMPPHPALAIAEESFDLRFRVGPAAAGRRRDGDDEAMNGIDRHPKPSGPSRAAKRVGRQRAQRPIAGGIVIDLDGATSNARRVRIAGHLSS